MMAACGEQRGWHHPPGRTLRLTINNDLWRSHVVQGRGSWLRGKSEAAGDRLPRPITARSLSDLPALRPTLS